MIHLKLSIVQALVGSWVGAGSGQYPSIKTFNYQDTISFSSTGQPFLFMTQQTKNPETMMPMHGECGYFQVFDNRQIEAVFCHAKGLTEVSEGTVSVDDNGDLLIELMSKQLNRISHASSPFVTQIRRRMRVHSNELHYTIDMATESNVVLTRHLEAVLQRQIVSN